MEENDFSVLGKFKREGSLWLKQHVYYVVVFLASFIILVFFPMIGSSATGWAFENYKLSDWCFYVGTKLLISILNFAIFFSFCKQGEYNSRNTESYKKAMELLNMVKNTEVIPKSPKQWKRQQYLTKGLTLSLTSMATLCIFTDIVMHYDWLALISYTITIVSAIIFGLLEMSTSEDYWQRVFLEYAEYTVKHSDTNDTKEVKKCSNSEIRNSETSKNRSRKTKATSRTSETQEKPSQVSESESSDKSPTLHLSPVSTLGITETRTSSGTRPTQTIMNTTFGRVAEQKATASSISGTSLRQAPQGPLGRL